MDTAESGRERAAIEQAIAALEGQRELLGSAVVDTALAPLRQQLEQRDRIEQRKLVTVLFSDLVDFTVLSQHLDAEDTRDVVNEYFQRWRDAVEAHGGVVEKYIGDAVMAVFGLYRAREDDPHSAIRAALTMSDRMAELNAAFEPAYGITLAMRVGIDTGDVVVSTLGERSGPNAAGNEFVAVGETVNRAARLQAAAPVGGVLISTDTHQHVRGAFGFRPVTGLQLKGIAAAVDAFEVLSERPHEFHLDAARGVEGVETTTVGREIELHRLQERLWDVVDEQCWHAVTVLGEAGVGKSRLLGEFDRWLAEMPEQVWWFRGRATRATQNTAGALLRDLISARFSIHANDTASDVAAKCAAGFAVGLGDAPPEGRRARLAASWLGFELGDDVSAEVERLDPRTHREQALGTLAAYFSGLGAQAPVVLLLEDVHWADDLSLESLDVADAAFRHAPILVVATARPDLLDRRPRWGEGLAHHSRLLLEPLSRRSSRALLDQLLAKADDVPQSLVELVITAAEGNPYYLEELVTWLVARGVLVRGQDRWTVAADQVDRLGTLPPTLRGVLQARVDALTAPQRTVLQRAAVIGRVFWDDAVVRLGDDPPDQVVPRLTDLRQRELIDERELSTFAGTRERLFRHALLRDVVYDGVLRAHRRAHHRTAAEWLREAAADRVDEQAASIAEHLDLAGEAANAASWYRRAAARAARMYASAEAVRLLDRGLELVGDDDVLRFDLLVERQAVHDWTGARSLQRADLDALDRLGEQLDDAARRVTLLLARAQWAFVHSEWSHQERDARAAAEVAEQAGLEHRRADALLMWGKALTWQADHAGARAVIDGALSTARASGHPSVEAEALRYLAIVDGNTDRWDDALEHLAAAQAVFTGIDDQQGVGTVLIQAATVWFHLGRLAEARRATEESLAIFRASGNLYREAAALGNLASIAVRQGQLGTARRCAEESLEAGRQLEDPEVPATPLAALGEVYLAAGDLTAAAPALESAYDAMIAAGNDQLAAGVRSQQAVVAIDRGEIDAALGWCTDALRHAEAAQSGREAAVARLVLGLAQVAAGQDEAADATLRAVERDLAALRLDVFAREATVARAALAPDDAAAVMIAPVIEHLGVDGLAGTMRPAAMVETVATILRRTGDERSGHVARLAVEYVAERAELIDDDELRAAFLVAEPQRRLLALDQLTGTEP